MSSMLLYSALLAIATFTCYALPQPGLLNDPPTSIHALLVAGSNGFNNYRHQADLAHAYHLLIEKGVPADNIVTMMYDDVAYDPRNPNPGELRNIWNGPDYRKGMKVDYRTTSVNKYVFQAVLSGDSTVASAFAGSGRVLKSTSSDNVFIFYTDHGAYNILGMPSGPVITRSDLVGYIEHARALGKFHKLSIYIEAFNGLTASSSTEDSYACNCAKSICYADLFSYKWMTSSEQHNLMQFSINQQYSDVKKEVRSSTVQMFGSPAVTEERVGYFQGTKPSKDVVSMAKLSNSSEHSAVVSIRDVPIHSLLMRAKDVRGGEHATRAAKELQQALQKREGFHIIFDNLLKRLHLSTEELQEEHEVEKSLQDQCYETLVLEFDEHCFPLRNNAFAFGSLRRFRPFCAKASRNAIQRAIDAMRLYCIGNPVIAEVQGVE
ncbi:peptidase C13 family protein [Ancylostoma ceylanicum]|uniref:Peptidase C13 family protein n=1 Tax=Ancylostoma ceylanicum TaxID=53326 RepID=A0A0D6M1P1_9BILA|nr:peptidase C13 family protein [Ancylostoma ceylanicum]